MGQKLILKITLKQGDFFAVLHIIKSDAGLIIYYALTHYHTEVYVNNRGGKY